jgi:hypothetical protein
MKLTVLILLSLAFLSGCKVDATSALVESQGDLTLYVYKEGKPVVETQIPPESAMYKELNRWVSENTIGWSYSLATYVPLYLVQGKSLSLNFQGTRVILNTKDGQFVKNIDPSEYDFIKI